MEGSRDSPEGGDHLPLNSESNLGLVPTDLQTHKPAFSPSKFNRSITPRGQIFSSLNSAHRNITSRSTGTNNSSWKASDQDDLNNHRDESDKHQNSLDSYPGSDSDHTGLSSDFGQPIIHSKGHLPKDAGVSPPTSPCDERSRSLASPRLQHTDIAVPPSAMPSKAKSSETEITTRVKALEREASPVGHAVNGVHYKVISTRAHEDKNTNTTTQAQGALTTTTEKASDQTVVEECGDRSKIPGNDDFYKFRGMNLARVTSPSEPPQSCLPGFPYRDAQVVLPTDPGEGS